MNATIDNTPTIDQFRPAVLRVLSDGSERTFRQVCELAADYLGLSESIREETLNSGQPRYMNRIGWACSALTTGGLLDRPQRGVYRISANGHAVDARNLKEYSEKDMMEWPLWREYQAEVTARRADRAGIDVKSAKASDGIDQPMVESIAQDASSKEADPVELMATAESDFNAKTETELRRRLQEASPSFFEKAVLELLWAMGYGGAHGKKQHAGRTGDGGIDGIIRQDALGLTNVYIQAKRYADENKVGSPEMRNFIGSLDTHGATLGVFITTSSFQAGAAEAAANYRHGRIVLIDGIELTSLMLNYGVAVHKAKQYTLYTIDDDFFDDELA